MLRLSSIATMLMLAVTSLDAAQPNIVLILADDMGYSDLGCYGSEIETPNLDRLASGGVRVTQFYNIARCCPTRAALMTGLYPHQAGVGHMCQDAGDPAYRGQLNDRCATLAEALRAGGYATAMVGKWHLSNLSIGGGNPQTKALLNFQVDGPISPDTLTWPVNRGFDQHYGTIAGVGSFFDPYSLVHNEEPFHPQPGFYYTDFINDRATQFVEQLAGGSKPFFLYVAHTAPHWPMHATDEAAIAKYQKVYEVGWDVIRQQRLERMKQLGIVSKETVLGEREGQAWDDAPNKAWQARRMAVYATMIEQMDRGIGRLFDAIKQRGIERNTLVVFLSDNGACAENVQPNWYDVPTSTRDGREIRVGNDPKIMPADETTFQSCGPEWANASNTPMRHFKHYTEEGGIAAPFVIRWPEQVDAGRIETKAVGHVIDLMPTFLAAAGVRYPTELEGRAILPVEGTNLLSAIEGQASDRGPIFWEHEGNRAVRVGDWKLVAEHGKPWQLYDLSTDRNELRDLAKSDPKRVEEMKLLYDAWAQRVGVKPWPVRKPR